MCWERGVSPAQTGFCWGTNLPPQVPRDDLDAPPISPQSRYSQAKLSIHDRALKVAAVVESLEREMELLCLTGVEDQLQADVRPTLEMLRNAGIKVQLQAHETDCFWGQQRFFPVSAWPASSFLDIPPRSASPRPVPPKSPGTSTCHLSQRMTKPVRH